MWSKALTFQLKPGRYPEYKKAHDQLWPEPAEGKSIIEVMDMAFAFGRYKEGLEES